MGTRTCDGIEVCYCFHYKLQSRDCHCDLQWMEQELFVAKQGKLFFELWWMCVICRGFHSEPLVLQESEHWDCSWHLPLVY
ncbi:hypothetical protein MtrunA17_Chr8g0392611 [Medicago truncatula]|uniref:Uncharacterized protein n=1 Tax=Medicago truncatula TaxID=3880 RepID=A0A396GZ02_MEDTR|nr:hypothetical protein MtrunA17_Chr8g0392611 [Medicago truncatula]